MSTARAILMVFDEYKRDRIKFISAIAELALKPENIDCLLEAKILDLLTPLIHDVCPQIQHSAVIAIGRIAHNKASIGAELMQRGILEMLLLHLKDKNKYFKHGVMFTVRAICKHSEELTHRLVCGGVLISIMQCLTDFDPKVREAAAWACGYIARHSPDLAKSVVDAGTLPHLVLLLKESDMSVRRVAASAIADIVRHSVSCAGILMDSNAIGFLVRGISFAELDEQYKRQCLLALSCLARHSYKLAQAVLDAINLRDVLLLLAHECPQVRRNTAMLIRDFVKHDVELAELVMNEGGVGALVEVIQIKRPKECEVDDHRIPVVTALGYIAGHGQHLAKCIVGAGGASAVLEVFEYCDQTSGSELAPGCAWTIGQIGQFCAQEIAETGVLPQLLQTIITAKKIPEELRSRCENSLKKCLRHLKDMNALEPLINDAPTDILILILQRMTEILPNDAQARRRFVVCGGLQRVQQIHVEPGTKEADFISCINSCFPEEIVQFYTPGYPDMLLEKVEMFVPENPCGADIRMGPVPSRSSIKTIDSLVGN